MNGNLHFLTEVVIKSFCSDHSRALFNRLLIRHMGLVCSVDYRCTSTESINGEEVVRSMTRKITITNFAATHNLNSLMESFVIEEDMPSFMVVLQSF